MRRQRQKNRTDFAILLRKHEAECLHQIMSILHKVERKEQYSTLGHFLTEHYKMNYTNFEDENQFVHLYEILDKLYDEIFDKKVREKIKGIEYKKLKIKFIYIIFDQLQLTQKLPRDVKHLVEIIGNDTTVEEVLEQLNGDFDADYR